MTTVSADAVSELVRELLPVANIADLKLQDAPDETKLVVSLGHTTPGDGGHEIWYWESTSSDSDDSANGIGLVTTVTPTGHSGAGRFKRIRNTAFALTSLAAQATYTVVANNTAGSAAPTAVSTDALVVGDAASRYTATTLAGQLQEISTATRTFATTALMTAGTARYDGELVEVTSYYAADTPDGGGGKFKWSAASSATANGGTVFAADAGGAGRWLRVVDDGIYTVKLFGALGDDATLNDTAIGNAITYCAANAKALYVPDGIFRHATALDFSGVSVFGNGITSELKATVNGACAVKYDGDSNFSVCDLKLSYTGGGSRTSTANGRRLTMVDCTDFEVRNVTVTGASGGGIIMSGCQRYKIIGNNVKDTLADGIHNTNVCKKGLIAHNRVKDTGDDGIAVVGYVSNGAQCEDITIAHNHVDGGSSRGIAVLGLKRGLVQGNNVNTPTFEGVIWGQDSSFTTYGCDHLLIAGNMLFTCGRSSNSNGAVHGVGDATYFSNHVRIEGNQIIDPRSRGITCGTGANNKVRIAGNTVRNATGLFMNLDSITDCYIEDNTFDTNTVTGIFTDSAMAGVLSIQRNKFLSTNSGAGATNDAITVTAAAGLTELICTGNVRTGAQSIERGMQNGATSAAITFYGNRFLGTTATVPNSNVGEGVATFNPASLADGAGETTTVTVSGAVLGDYANASFSLDLQGITLTAWVSAADTVSVRFQNETGGALDLASGTLRARVSKA